MKPEPNAVHGAERREHNAEYGQHDLTACHWIACHADCDDPPHMSNERSYAGNDQSDNCSGGNGVAFNFYAAHSFRFLLSPEKSIPKRTRETVQCAVIGDSSV
jgi:hypothetical protein